MKILIFSAHMNHLTTFLLPYPSLTRDKTDEV